MSTTKNIPIKVKLVPENEFRRFSIPEDSTWPQFQQLLAQTFGTFLPSSYKAQYQDEDGDFITMSSSEELQSAVKYCAQIPLQVVLQSIPSAIPSATASESSSSSVEGPILANVVPLETFENPFVKDLLRRIESWAIADPPVPFIQILPFANLVSCVLQSPECKDISTFISNIEQHSSIIADTVKCIHQSRENPLVRLPSAFSTIPELVQIVTFLRDMTSSIQHDIAASPRACFFMRFPGVVPNHPRGHPGMHRFRPQFHFPQDSTQTAPEHPPFQFPGRGCPRFPFAFPFPPTNATPNEKPEEPSLPPTHPGRSGRCHAARMQAANHSQFANSHRNMKFHRHWDAANASATPTLPTITLPEPATPEIPVVSHKSPEQTMTGLDILLAIGVPADTATQLLEQTENNITLALAHWDAMSNQN